MKLSFAKSILLIGIASCGAAMSSCSVTDHHSNGMHPLWLESDSILAIQARIASDFSLKYADGAEQIIEKHPELTADSLEACVKAGYIETMDIDGERMMHKKAVRNFDLLHPAYNEGWTNRGCSASAERLAYADSTIRWSKGKLPAAGPRRVKIRFNIDVPYDSVLQGDTLRVWMPFPREAVRQTGVKLLGTSQPNYVISDPEQSAHSTIYMQAPVQEGQPTHFDYEAEFIASGAYFAPKEILAAIKPYDKESQLYKEYTAFDCPHYVRLDSLAQAIVGNESNPFRQSELVYDYIVTHYPWAGAREYSTIPCIPAYVIESGHGDCGQVSLLYISLMRTLGVPARWESGWMLHPGEKNLHDWAETYYEGVGWVPVDVSFGRYTASKGPAVRNFYSTGIDNYRFVANQGVCEPFIPHKKYVRSETVDNQMGEVECSKGNLFYPAWTRSLQILSSTPTSL